MQNPKAWSKQILKERLDNSALKGAPIFFQLLNKVEEGTYGVVYRAIERKTKEIVALKRLKMEKEKEGFPITSLREINTLLIAQHPNVVTVREIVVGSDMDRIYIGNEFKSFGFRCHSFAAKVRLLSLSSSLELLSVFYQYGYREHLTWHGV